MDIDEILSYYETNNNTNLEEYKKKYLIPIPNDWINIFDVYNWSNFKKCSMFNLPFHHKKESLTIDQIKEGFNKRLSIYINKYYKIIGTWSNLTDNLKMMGDIMGIYSHFCNIVSDSEEPELYKTELGDIVIVREGQDLSLLRNITPNTIIFIHGGFYSPRNETKSIIIPVNCYLIGILNNKGEFPIITGYDNIIFLNNANYSRISSIIINIDVIFKNTDILIEDVYINKNIIIENSNCIFLLSSMLASIDTINSNVVFSYSKINSLGHKDLVMLNNNKLIIDHCDIFTNINITISELFIFNSVFRKCKVRINLLNNNISIYNNVIKGVKFNNTEQDIINIFYETLKIVNNLKEIVYDWILADYNHTVFDIITNEIK